MNFNRPTELNQALELLGKDQWTVLAGGTDFYPSLRGEAVRDSTLDITAIEALKGIAQEDGGYRIGALTTWTQILNEPLPSAFNALQQAARDVGSIQIQNRATLAGNLCNASPAADGVPPLLILDASVELRSTHAVRSVPLTQFIQGNRKTRCRDDELVSSVFVPHEACAGSSAFSKLGARRYLVISIAMVAARAVVTNGRIEQLAIAIGSCSEVAQRLSVVENLLQGVSVNEDPVSLINVEHLSALSPIDDIRASADYRLNAAVELVKRTISQSLEAVT